ncbi:MAG: hypothetical protein Tsb007_30230 [Rhizobacter sp.]
MKPLVLKQPAATPVSVRPPEKSSAGVPLVNPLRASMEQRFGADFSQVRVHADAHAEAATRGLDADAFASRDQLHFASGRFQPTTPAGQHLIAHELAHVLQQRGGPAVLGADGLEQEADSAADAVLAGRSVQVAGRGNAPALQRKPKKFNAEFDLGHEAIYKEPHKFKTLFVQWRSDLTELITARLGPANDPLHDYRFVLMLAQRALEQDGPREKAEGNNPYNVMGRGDATPDQFFREDNEEGPAGAKEKVPAWFANFTAEGAANGAYLDLLARGYPEALKAIADGGSTTDFVNGLYPGKPNNYATAAKKDYVNGVRRRARMIVGDLRRIYSAYLAEYRAKLQANPAGATPPAVAGDAEWNQIIVTLLERELVELDELTDRIAGGGPVNRPAATGAAP